MSRSAYLPAIAISLLLALSATAGPVEYIGPDETSGSSRAVIVAGQALAHTGQMMSLDKQGNIIGEGSVDTQLAQAIFNLETALAAAGSDMDHLVKLNLYVDSPRTAEKIKKMFSKRFPAPVRPAMSWVCTPLPHPKAILALDAIGVIPDAAPHEVVRTRCEALAGEPRLADVAVLPRGGAVYVSGMSAKGDMASATAETMDKLIDTITLLGLKPKQVVQLKAFVGSMAEADAIRKAIAKSFPGKTAPPVVLVEWTSTGSVEIELIAAMESPPSNATASGPVTYFTPPGVTASPVYSKVACVHGDKHIYISGLYSQEPGDGTAQVNDVFAKLKSIAKESGTDMRHLAKATYYVSDKDPSAMLNKLRPDYYDPRRPPAASKAMVHGVGMADRSLTIDMIAVGME